jgi:hypothetical protein
MLKYEVPPRFILPVIGQLYTADNTTVQSVPTGATYTKLTNLDTSYIAVNCTVDTANSQIETATTGLYRVFAFLSISVDGPVNDELRGAVFLNGTEQGQLHWARSIDTSGNYASTSAGGFLKIEDTHLAGGTATVDFRARHSDAVNPEDFIVEYASLVIERAYTLEEI